MLKSILLAQLLTLTSASTAAVPPSPLMTVAWPAIDRIGGHDILRYEVTVSNSGSLAIELEAVRVSDGSKILAELSGDALRAGALETGIAPGQAQVIYFDIDLPRRKPPAALVHRLQYRVNGKTRFVDSGPTAIARANTLVLGPPLAEGTWVAVHNADWPRGHRRMVYALDGHPTIPGRFAIDWVGVGPSGAITRGDPDRPADASGYGARAVAVADARVIALRNDMSEATTISGNGAHALGDAAGNYVVLDLGGGRYGFYEHLKPGSITVAVGERVRRGQAIGALGFSGDSTGPHLHFHVADQPRPLRGEGLPFTIERFTQCGRFDDLAAMGMRRWDVRGARRTVRSERPEAGAVVSFGNGACAP